MQGAGMVWNNLLEYSLTSSMGIKKFEMTYSERYLVVYTNDIIISESDQ